MKIFFLIAFLIVLASCDKILLVVDNSNILKTHSKWIHLLQYPRNNETK